MELNEFIEAELNGQAQRIISRGDNADEWALGKITFLMALRRVLGGKATMQDLGLMDAVNDTLQQLGRIEKGQTFYKAK